MVLFIYPSSSCSVGSGFLVSRISHSFAFFTILNLSSSESSSLCIREKSVFAIGLDCILERREIESNAIFTVSFVRNLSVNFADSFAILRAILVCSLLFKGMSEKSFRVSGRMFWEKISKFLRKSSFLILFASLGRISVRIFSISGKFLRSV